MQHAGQVLRQPCRFAIGSSSSTSITGAVTSNRKLGYDHGNARNGRDWDASLSLSLAKGVTGVLKLADYRATAFAADTRKLWLQLEYKGNR